MRAPSGTSISGKWLKAFQLIVIYVFGIGLCACQTAPELEHMNIIEKFEYHFDRGEWDHALPAIEEIVSKQEGYSTSWYNYGVVLNNLERYGDAATAFKRAYQLGPEDYSLQYQVFHNLALAGDAGQFALFAAEELEKMPELSELIESDENFKLMTESVEYKKVVESL